MKKQKLPKVLVIVGPTTTHKTHLAVEFSQLFNGEIINADAYQVYKNMQIGTNAPDDKQKQLATFHLNQFLKLDEEWDIKKFQDLCNQTINSLIKNNKLPILVGGSGLYIDAVIKNYKLSASKRNDKYDNLSNQELFDLLAIKNKTIADKIGVNNRKRLSRALQVIEETNNPKGLNLNNKPLYDLLLVECNYSTRDELYQTINQKVDSMFKAGWIDEVKKIMQLYPNLDYKSNNAFKSIGYRNIYESIINKTKLDVEKIKQDIRHYAKRQITWINNKYPQHLVFNQKNKNKIINEIKKWLKIN